MTTDVVIAGVLVPDIVVSASDDVSTEVMLVISPTLLVSALDIPDVRDAVLLSKGVVSLAVEAAECSMAVLCELDGTVVLCSLTFPVLALEPAVSTAVVDASSVKVPDVALALVPTVEV